VIADFKTVGDFQTWIGDADDAGRDVDLRRCLNDKKAGHPAFLIGPENRITSMQQEQQLRQQMRTS
jgi:hypothetical protein